MLIGLFDQLIFQYLIFLNLKFFKKIQIFFSSYNYLNYKLNKILNLTHLILFENILN